MSALRISAEPSVELLVAAPDGSRTGHDPVADRDLNQIPSSNYSFVSIASDSAGSASNLAQREVSLNMPAAGRYLVQAIAVGPGAFTVHFKAFDSKGAVTTSQFSGTASPGDTFVYAIRYSPVAGSKIDVTQLTPFASLSASINVTAGSVPKFQATGDFTLGPGSAGFDSSAQQLTLQVASYSATIPPGSFRRDKKGVYSFHGEVEGIPLRARITPQAGNAFAFDFEVQGIDLSAAINPLRFLLLAGHNAGSQQVNAISH